MPLFDFYCKACDKTFELLVKNSTTVPACPACQKKKLTKNLPVFSVGKSDPLGSSAPAMPPCGTCGDPRGAGACKLD